MKINLRTNKKYKYFQNIKIYFSVKFNYANICKISHFRREKDFMWFPSFHCKYKRYLKSDMISPPLIDIFSVY